MPLVRFVDHTLTREMAQYVVMHALIHHRSQRYFDAARRSTNGVSARRCAAPKTRASAFWDWAKSARCAPSGCAISTFPSPAGAARAKDVRGVESFAGAGELAPFLAHSDILVCLLPLTEETRGILNAKTFALLPKGAFVINAARGGHLIEDDLVDAIDSGHLSGATLDVFQIEPLPRDSVLWNHPKITVTPHVAAITDPRAAAASIAAGIAAYQRGDTLENRVDLDKGY